MYKRIIRPVLFLFDPEKVHYFIANLLVSLCKIPGFKGFLKIFYTPKNTHNHFYKQNIWGITFENPIGLAAGFDKNAKWIDELSYFGFGFIEIGTLTPKPQEGNPKKRLFRLPKDKAILNRMGFNNLGVELAIQNLKKRKSKIIVGGNIGKNKNTPNENAQKDYIIGLKSLATYVDYFVVNVSSPNTPNLRELQEKEHLEKLLIVLQRTRNVVAEGKPLLLKIAPDLSENALQDIASIVLKTSLDGIILTNTTIDRTQLITPQNKVKEMGTGGVSGIPLRKKSTEMLQKLRKMIGNDVPIIAVGGIFTGKDALEKINAGANLVQVYTGLIYEGPAIVKNILKYLKKHRN